MNDATARLIAIFIEALRTQSMALANRLAPQIAGQAPLATACALGGLYSGALRLAAAAPNGFERACLAAMIAESQEKLAAAKAELEAMDAVEGKAVAHA